MITDRIARLGRLSKLEIDGLWLLCESAHADQETFDDMTVGVMRVIVELRELRARQVAVMPVIRAAEACRDSPDEFEEEDEAFRELCAAVDTMRILNARTKESK